ncbi:hypothetical protein Fmac_020845 [Flemingia macrophylla]|uniref:DUF4283 domain-containing protein n=1 Tax=Flemingia macrophylla TaxID=520843 RepID=A0ABD1LV55_9FABA
MEGRRPVVPCKFLDGFDGIVPPSTPKKSPASSFALAVQRTCDVPCNLLPQPCRKGDKIAVVIPEDEYSEGLKACKNCLHGRISVPKGASPPKYRELQECLRKLWLPTASWHMTALGRGFYKFAFDSLQDQRRVLAGGSWGLKPGFLRVFAWTEDFDPHSAKNTRVQCWIRIYGLPQEYWRPRILFSIAKGVGAPLALDRITAARELGYFARILVDMDLLGAFPEQILVERKGFAFVVDITYEQIPDLCTNFHNIGHNIQSCQRLKPTRAPTPPSPARQDPGQSEPPKEGQVPHNTGHGDSNIVSSDDLQVAVENKECSLESSEEDPPDPSPRKGKEILEMANSEELPNSVVEDMATMEDFLRLKEDTLDIDSSPIPPFEVVRRTRGCHKRGGSTRIKPLSLKEASNNSVP